MKMLAALIAGLLLSMTTFATGLVVAVTYLAAEESEHPLNGKDGTTLWSTAPVAVDKTAQAFERLPPRPAPKIQTVAALSETTTGAKSAINATPAESRMKDEPAIDPTVTGAIDTQAQPEQEQASWRDSAHTDWCSRRYRSYDEQSNSYRPYGGGRRACESPYSDMTAIGPVEDSPANIRGSEEALWQVQSSSQSYNAIVEQVALTEDGDTVTEPDHIQSCLARYRSYRPRDNSYQPFDGGPRRQCE